MLSMKERARELSRMLRSFENLFIRTSNRGYLEELARTADDAIYHLFVDSLIGVE